MLRRDEKLSCGLARIGFGYSAFEPREHLLLRPPAICLELGNDHDLELKAFGFVNGHQLDASAAVCCGVRLSHELCKQRVNAIAQQNKPEWDFLGGGLTPRPQIVHMTGQIPPASGAPGVLHDAGIIYPPNKGAYVLVFMNQSTVPNNEIGIKAGTVSQNVFAVATA